MKSKFHKVRLVDKGGNLGSYYWAKKDKIVGVTVIMVPGKIAGPGGELIAEQKAGIDLGTGGLLVVNSSPEEILKVLDAEE